MHLPPFRKLHYCMHEITRLLTNWCHQGISLFEVCHLKMPRRQTYKALSWVSVGNLIKKISSWIYWCFQWINTQNTFAIIRWVRLCFEMVLKLSNIVFIFAHLCCLSYRYFRKIPPSHFRRIWQCGGVGTSIDFFKKKWSKQCVSMCARVLFSGHQNIKPVIQPIEILAYSLIKRIALLFKKWYFIQFITSFILFIPHCYYLPFSPCQATRIGVISSLLSNIQMISCHNGIVRCAGISFTNSTWHNNSYCDTSMIWGYIILLTKYFP